MTVPDLPTDVLEKYEVYDYKHASSILKSDFPTEWNDIVDMLSAFKLRKSWIVTPGGRKSQIAEAIEGFLNDRGWKPERFKVTRTVANLGGEQKSVQHITHEVDCFKNRVALEIEWNNKDPFYDRDLRNFSSLAELQAVSVGVIVTRADELQRLFNELDRGCSFGSSTTIVSKLLQKIDAGCQCPLLVIAIGGKLYDPEN